MSCSLNLYLHHDQLFISLYYYTECIIYMIIIKHIILHNNNNNNNNNEALCITILCITLNVYYVYMTLCMYNNMYNYSY